MSSKPEDRRSSEMRKLFESCSPWLPPQQLAVEILGRWMSHVPWRSCGLAWADQTSGIAGLLGHRNTTKPTTDLGEVSFSITEIKTSLAHGEALSSVIDSWSPHLPDLGWKEALDGRDCQVIWGCEGEMQPEFDRDLIDAGLQIMVWGLEFQRQLRLQKLTALAEYAAGAGHEINNPLGSIIGRASQLLKDEPDLERRRLLENIGAQAYRIRDMIGDTMLFARPPSPQKEAIVLAELVSEVLGRFSSPIAAQQIQVELNLGASETIEADRTQLQIVFSELIRNSLHAMPDGGEISIEVSQEHNASGDWYRIDFSDNGPGLTDEQIEHCFDPFFSGRQAGRGLGFGLSKCWQILRQHGGKMDLLTEPGKTTFAMWWPVISLDGNDD